MRGVNTLISLASCFVDDRIALDQLSLWVVAFEIESIDFIAQKVRRFDWIVEPPHPWSL